VSVLLLADVLEREGRSSPYNLSENPNFQRGGMSGEGEVYRL
jgi:hypothetical protein